ncbi:MAG: DNA mismatch repair protein MutT, partial [Selenomonas sp.]|nr:DNA mismatch repair protein MutT [Selenomonas sp.]
VTFVSDRWETEYMHLFTATGYTGAIHECDEGVLEWIDKDKVYDLPLWEGDKIFFRLMAAERPHFSLKLRYVGEELVEAVLDGKDIIN